jgi:hypothetical protein
LIKEKKTIGRCRQQVRYGGKPEILFGLDSL